MTRATISDAETLTEVIIAVEDMAATVRELLVRSESSSITLDELGGTLGGLGLALAAVALTARNHQRAASEAHPADEDMGELGRARQQCHLLEKLNRELQSELGREREKTSRAVGLAHMTSLHREHLAERVKHLECLVAGYREVVDAGKDHRADRAQARCVCGLPICHTGSCSVNPAANGHNGGMPHGC